VEPPDGPIRRDAAPAPGHSGVVGLYQADDQPRGVGKGDCSAPAAAGSFVCGATTFPYSTLPKINRAERHREGGDGNLPLAMPSWRDIPSFIGEGGPDGSGRAPLVAVIEVIDVVIIEIHRLLEEAESQEIAIKLEINSGVIDGGGDMVQTKDGVLQEGLRICTCFVTNASSASRCSGPRRFGYDRSGFSFQGGLQEMYGRRCRIPRREQLSNT
jgi:hypothetical protein